MAERAQSWREVRLGAAILALLAVGLFTLWIQRGQNPFAESYALLLYVEDAKGLQEGAPITLSGVLVGEVRRIDVLSPSEGLRARYADRLKGMNIRVVLGVDERYREEITERSQARIALQGASGARFIRIEKGPVGGMPLRSGERIAVAPALDLEHLLARGAEVLNRIESLNRNAEAVRAKLKAGSGTLGKFVAAPADNEVAENFQEMNLAAARMMRALDEGQGTFALERRSGRIRANLTRFRAVVVDVQARVLRGEGSLGKLAVDTTLQRGVDRLLARTDSLTAKLDRGEGSLGRFLNDPELFNQLQVLTMQLDSLAAEIKEDPLGSIDIDLH